MEKQQCCERCSCLPPRDPCGSFLLSCNDRSCLLSLQHHSVSHPKGPATLPSPSCPVLWVCAETTSGTAAPGTNFLAGWSLPSHFQCVGGWTQLTRSSAHAASPPQQRWDLTFNSPSLPLPHWLWDSVTNVFYHSL